MIRRPMNLNWVIPAEGLRHISNNLNRQWPRQAVFLLSNEKASD